MSKNSFFRLIAAGMASVLLLACSSSDELEPANTSGSPQPQSEDLQTVNILFLPKASTYSEAVPRMVSNVGDKFFIEQTIPGQPGMKALQMIDYKSNSTYAAIMTERSAIICRYPEDGSLPPSPSKVLMGSQSDEGLRLAICDMNWETGEFTINRETFIEEGGTRASRGDMDFAYELTDKLLLDIGSRVETLGDIGGVLNLPVIGEVTSVFKLVGLSAARFLLWQDDPEKLSEVQEETVTDATVGFFANVLPSPLKRLWHGCSLATRWGGGNWWSETGPNVSEEDLNEGDSNDYVHLRVRHLSDIANSSQDEVEEWVEAKPKYIVKMSVSNVGETTATFSGSYRPSDDNPTPIWDMGYVLKGPEGERTILSQEMGTVNLTDLRPGSEYTVYAFVRTLFGTHTSPIQKFYTDGKIEVTPTSITFDYTGGTKGVAVTVGPNMTWDVTSMPGWCNMDGKADGSFWVKAGPTKESRQGTIVITATMANGQTRTASVSVSQTAEPVVIQGSSLYMFTGKLETRYHYVSWWDGTKKRDETKSDDPAEIFATIMIQDGKYVLTAPLGTIAFTQWIVGSTPPTPVDFNSYQEFNQSYSETGISVSGKCYKYTSDKHSWNKHNMTFSLTISGLNTSSPTLKSESYSSEEDYFDSSYISNIPPTITTTLHEWWHTENLSGVRY